MLELMFALTDTGPEILANLVPEGVDAAAMTSQLTSRLFVETDADTYTYSLDVPWSVLDAEPAVGLPLGFNIIVNVNDGVGRRGWLHWTPGIGERKSSADWGWLILAD